MCLAMASLSTPISTAQWTQKTIDRNRALEAVFLEAANYVDDFKAANTRLPTADEFNRWADTQPKKWPSVRIMFLETNPDYIQHRLYERYDDIDKTENFGTPPDDEYIIGLWRGEWFEYYISWLSTTTLTFDPKEYYIMSSAAEDFALFIFLFLLSTSFSIWLWRRPKTLNKASQNG